MTPNSRIGLEAADRAHAFVPHAFPEGLARPRRGTDELQHDLVRFPEMPHSMHGADPALFARTVTEWASALPA